MKIRALTNGNELDLPDDEAERLVESGLFEVIAEPKKAKVAEPTKAKQAGYKRRDMSAEK
jgi:hypothetical protein